MEKEFKFVAGATPKMSHVYDRCPRCGKDEHTLWGWSCGICFDLYVSSVKSESVHTNHEGEFGSGSSGFGL